MDRISFIGSIQGIESPNIIADFFDQLIALKQVAENLGTICITHYTDRQLTVSIHCHRSAPMPISGTIVIYGRPISINSMILTDNCIQMTLC